MKIVVLAGGTSTERAVSIISGTNVAKALQGRGHHAVLVDVFCGYYEEDVFAQPCDIEKQVAYMHSFDDKIPQMVAEGRPLFAPVVMRGCMDSDVVFMALHGSNGEDGKIQAAFELMGIKFTGSNYLGSALAMDKSITKQLFVSGNVPTPRGYSIVKRQTVLPDSEGKYGSIRIRPEAVNAPEEKGIGYPCVVKPACGGSSVGVSIAHNRDEYEKALLEGFSYENVLVVEEYISGREFSVGIIDGEAYPVIEIAPLAGFYDYHNKYQPGATVETCPAEVRDDLAKKMQDAALMAWKALHLDSYARVDVMMDRDENVYCLEANTLPGMTPMSLLPQEAAATGLDFGALCEKLISVSV